MSSCALWIASSFCCWDGVRRGREEFAGDVALEAADDLGFGQAFFGASFDVVLGGLVVRHAHDDDAPQRGVGVAVAAAVEPVPLVLPDDAWTGDEPHSAA